MKPKQPFLGTIDIGLIVGIVVFSLAGVLYAVFSGVISVPGVTPTMQVDAKPSPSAKVAVVETSPTPSPSPSPSPSNSVSPSPDTSPSTSPAPSGSPDPQAEMKAHDATRKEHLATIQTYLRDYSAKYKKFPLTNSGANYEKIETALKVLVDTGMAPSLPVDPLPDHLYMYLSDGKTYSLTAWLEDTSDPSGANNAESPPKYLYTVKNP